MTLALQSGVACPSAESCAYLPVLGQGLFQIHVQAAVPSVVVERLAVVVVGVVHPCVHVEACILEYRPTDVT